MGSALMRAIAKCEGTELYLFDTDKEKLDAAVSEFGVRASSALEIAGECDFIFLAVKPNIIPQAIGGIAEAVKARLSKVTVVSMAAGVDIASIHKAFGTEAVSVIRIMPNTPVSVGRGMIL